MEQTKSTNTSQASQTQSGRWKLLLVIAVCAAPMLASYFTYFVIKPGAATNYGTLLDPRLYPMPSLNTQDLQGKPLGLDAYKGKWLMVQVDSLACDAQCQKKLLDMRQLRTAQGKEMDRIERVWLITDSADTQLIDQRLMAGIEGTRLLKVDAARLQTWLPVESDSAIRDHIYLIDPLGNLMMRYPKNADANKIKKDLSKLLKASAIG
ncbi:MAG: cytochrome C oxidase subunit I [Burkholderiales bacterium]|nr:cytochrome C oxidase subunit I [Burkholderiales bacterium]